MEGPPLGAEEERKQEGAAETKCDKLTATSISHPPELLEGRRKRKLGVELSPGGREG